MNIGNASIKPNKIKSDDGTEFWYLGPPLGPPPEKGALPAFFYFSLSGEESLCLPPYNEPAAFFQDLPCRVFSLTLPGHGPRFDKFVAMNYWAEQMAEETYFLDFFFEKSAQAITWLIEKGYIASDKIAFGGLSRGAFAAAHIAARQPNVTTLLGFAPLTRPSHLKAFSSYLEFPKISHHLNHLDLHAIVPKLSHLKQSNFYIGMEDTLVGTDHCISFVKEMAAAKMNVELTLYPSVGHGGHGTPPKIFLEGAQWLKTQLLKE